MSFPFKIRPARLEDAGAIDALRMIRGEWQKNDPFHTMLASRTSAERQEKLASELNRDDRLLLVAEYDQKIVGWAKASLFKRLPEHASNCMPTGWQLSGLNVALEYRRQGLGKHLTQLRINWLRERTQEVFYFANAQNRASIALHQTFGFEEVTRDFSAPGVQFEGGEGILFRLKFPAL